MITNIPFNKSVIGFDYDGVLDKPLYQLIAHYLKTIGKNIHIITKRPDIEGVAHGSDDVYNISDMLGIPRRNVHFTDNKDKSPYILQNDIQAFYDDTLDNLNEINKQVPECITILVN